ncbi:MAG: hypothetical protein Q7U23_08820 [Methylococcales bacterium]|nr:hypothetical protein [Methylococcales bacterium]
MKKRWFVILIVCGLWQSLALAEPMTAILLGEVVHAIFSSDDKKDESKTAFREEVAGVDSSPKKHSGYQFHLTWQLPDDGAYSGVLEMRGKTGVFRVTTPKGDNIEQDMSAQPNEDKVVVTGSNPRYFENQLPASYPPDIFWLAKESGEWTITDACDEKGSCAKVTVLNANPL